MNRIETVMIYSTTVTTGGYYAPRVIITFCRNKGKHSYERRPNKWYRKAAEKLTYRPMFTTVRFPKEKK
jgi:hypothetical protein